MVMQVLIVGGQGTYENGCYHTEHPDRDLSLAHAGTVAKRCQDLTFDRVVCSGGYTQKATKHLSEAKSFENMWQVTGNRPTVKISVDTVALDSAENVIFGLMQLRLDNRQGGPIDRIGYYSQWQFKKARMTGLARTLGILERFYFYAYASFELANAGADASKGEEDQLRRMKAADDFLMLGAEWEAKRQQRFCLSPNDYAHRADALRQNFPRTFAAMDGLRDLTAYPADHTTGITFDRGSLSWELPGKLSNIPADVSILSKVQELIGELRAAAVKQLQEAFKGEVLCP